MQGRDTNAVTAQTAFDMLHDEWHHEYILRVRYRFWGQRRDGSGSGAGPLLSGGTPAELEDRLRRAWGET
jgi:hypothetical protein